VNVIISQEKFRVKGGYISGRSKLALKWWLKEKSGKRRAGLHRRHRGYLS